MAKATNTHVYMEILEEAEDKGLQPNKMWCKSRYCKVNRQCPSEFLADGKEQLCPYGNVQCKPQEGRLRMSYGLVSRMESKIGTAVCRTARTVV